MQTIEDVLKKRFGWSSFRPPQEDVIRHVLAGGSGLVIMPTGFGKSLCYQLPSVLFEGLTLVVSPLIALAEDQVTQARAKGLAATAINSSISREERERRWQGVRDGQIKLLYVTPERLGRPEFKESVHAEKVKLLAVDEAHCISQWGHDFRPEYGRLGEYRQELGNPPTLALTATASQKVQEEIRTNLGIENGRFWNVGMERPNLFLSVYEVHGLSEKIQRLVALKHQHPGPMIVYFSLISTLMKMSEELRKLNFSHVIYHGQLKDTDRIRAQKAFMKDQCDLILATPAFGLGVDKPNVRAVVHAELPGSIESYYQEVGRAGRDGLNSACELYYDPDDASIQMDFIKWANPDPEFVRSLFLLLQRNEMRVQQGGAEFLRGQLHFFHSRDYRLETALNWLERWGSIEFPHHDYRKLKVIGEIEGQWLTQEIYLQRQRVQNEKLLALIQWMNPEGGCRKVRIYQYFGHHRSEPCGQCDVCRGPVT